MQHISVVTEKKLNKNVFYQQVQELILCYLWIKIYPQYYNECTSKTDWNVKLLLQQWTF